VCWLLVGENVGGVNSNSNQRQVVEWALIMDSVSALFVLLRFIVVHGEGSLRRCRCVIC